MTTGRDGAADQSTVQSTAFAAPADAGSPSTIVAALAGTGSPSHLRGAMRLYSRVEHLRKVRHQHGALGETTKRTFCRLPASNMQDDLQALLDCLHEAERRAEDEETQPVLLLLLDLLLQAPLTTPLTPRPA